MKKLCPNCDSIVSNLHIRVSKVHGHGPYSEKLSEEAFCNANCLVAYCQVNNNEVEQNVRPTIVIG